MTARVMSGMMRVRAGACGVKLDLGCLAQRLSDLVCYAIKEIALRLAGSRSAAWITALALIWRSATVVLRAR